MKLLLLLAVALPLCAQVCPYTFAPAASQSLTVSADATTTPNTIAVTVPAGCNWLYSTNAAWISFPNQANLFGSGNGVISWVAAVNLGPGIRSGNLTVNTLNGTVTFTVVQAAPVCALTLNPASASAVLDGGSGTFQLQTNCTWAAASQSSFVALTSATSGSLNATMSYSVSANKCVAGRSGAIAVQAGGASGLSQTFQVNQDGSPANLTLTPASLTATAGASDGMLAIATDASCSWTAYSDVSWLTITVASGSGNASLAYHVLANTSAQRSGNIHVGAQLFTVTQQAVAAATVTLSAVLNGADYAQGAVSPGEIVALFGANIGPPAPGAIYQLTAGGSLPTTLGNVQLLFDATPAPLLYASAGQVNAVVPYGVTGSTKVQLTYLGAPSNILTLPAQSATPGILTLDRSGFGGGAILNQDLSVNTPANPAVAGSIVVIYCVGGGATVPASADGSVIGVPAPVLAQAANVSVTIGGLNAIVKYSGAVSYSIAGLTQINAVVPPELTAHGQIPIVVTIGKVASQTGATVAIQ